MKKTLLVLATATVAFTGCSRIQHKLGTLMGSNPTAAPADQTATPTPMASASPAAMMVSDVMLTKTGFSPSTINLKVGDSLKVTNNETIVDSLVNAPGSTFTFSTGKVPAGKSAVVLFTKAGTYTFMSSVHPTMKGTVIVK